MLSQLDLPTVFHPSSGPVILRRVEPADVHAVVALIAEDAVSASRGDTTDPADAPSYERALGEIIADTSNEVVLAIDSESQPVATLQLTRIPGIGRRGAVRLLVEAVHVRSDSQSTGIGTALMRWVIEAAAPALGATVVQLTSDAARPDAHRFYVRLGFTPSHVGFKLQLPGR